MYFSPGLDDVLFFCFLLVCFCFPSLFFLSALLVCLDFGLFWKSLYLKDLDLVALEDVWCGAVNVTNMKAVEGEKIYSRGDLC